MKTDLNFFLQKAQFELMHFLLSISQTQDAINSLPYKGNTSGNGEVLGVAGSFFHGKCTHKHTRHFRRKKNFLRPQFCKFAFPNGNIRIFINKLYASPIVIVNILFCSLCLSPLSSHMVTTSCFPGINQAISSRRWNACTVSMCFIE